ncbi:DNA-directed RNA polymerase II core subunit [Trapelia coarctata]|nr:DNA-directed RNA polymerase II core subunit [Trapelia coarctata]
MTHNTSGDAVDRHEQILIPFGNKKVKETSVNRAPFASTFYSVGEDQSLGNMLRAQLLQCKHVVFAGYRVPHPDVAKMEIRVHTDGEITPREAVLYASRELVHHLDLLSRRFLLEWEFKKAANAAAAGDGGAGAWAAEDKVGDDKGPRIKEVEVSPYGEVMGD